MGQAGSGARQAAPVERRVLPGKPEIAFVEARGGDRSRRRTGTTCRMNLGSVSAAVQGVLAYATASAVTRSCTHRIRLAPTSAQAAAFRCHAGFARLGYNGAVSAFSSGLADDDWRGDQTLRPRFNAIKDERRERCPLMPAKVPS